jgi:pimeloyl-ACP methyl ester carboxylesterase
MPTIRTELLNLAYEDGGPAEGPPVLLHGWPDAPRGWRTVARHLQAAGWRTIMPYLRGTSPTQFLSPDTPRVASGVALAQDAIDLLDGLQLTQVVVVGHDWGARAAYTLAALFPARVTAVVALALAYQPRGYFTLPGFAQSRLF